MSVNREEFADQQANLRDRSAMAKGLYDESRQKERTVENLITKMLKRSEAVQVQQNANFNKAVRDISASNVMGEGGISKDVKAIVDKISAVQGDTANTKSIGESKNLKTRIGLISKLVEENDNIKGVELDQINNMIGLVREQIKTERKERHGFASDISKSMIDNLPDTASLIAGITGDSPAMMFMTKIMGDFVKDKWKKRKEALAENQDILAEQLDVHQVDAYDQREEQTKAIRELKESIKDENTANAEGKLEPAPTKIPKIPKLERSSESESETTDIQPLGETSGIDITPMVEQQEQTNKILDSYIDIILRGNMNDTEERREAETRQDRLFGLLSKRKGGKIEKVKGKGFWGKLFSGFGSLLGLGSLGAIFTSISTYISVTAIPAITGFLGTVAGLIAPVLAGLALLKVVTTIFTNLFNAGKTLGKDDMDVTIMDRVAIMIGGIMEGFASVADFIAGLFGFDTKLQEWWNLNFTRPLAEFLGNFSLSKMWDGLIDFALKIPKLMFEYSPIGLLLKGLNYFKKLFNLEPVFQPVTDTFDSLMGVFGNIKDFILSGIEKLIGFIWEYSPFGIIMKGIEMISDILNFDAIIKKVQSLIDGMIPDFLKGDTDQKKADDAYVTETLTKQGIVDHDRIGDSEIKDWDALSKLEPEQIQKVINFGDFGDEDIDRMNALKDQATKRENDDISKDRMKFISVGVGDMSDIIKIPSVDGEESNKMLSYDYNENQKYKWNDNDLVRMAEKISSGKPVNVGYNYIPKDESHINPFAPANKAVMDERIKKNNLQIAEMNQQPVLQDRAEQAENIERSVKTLEDAKAKQLQPIVASNNNAPVTTNQHTTINQPSTPFNNDRGINSLQAVFQP